MTKSAFKVLLATCLLGSTQMCLTLVEQLDCENPEVRNRKGTESGLLDIRTIQN